MGVSDRWWISRAVICLLIIPRINGWGKDGHYVICKIAENYLTEDALAAVKALLPDHAEGDLADVCSWPDEVRRNPHYRWSSPLHYVDTPDFRCNYQYSNNLTEALMFLSHFIGDVHQVWDNMIIESALKTFYNSDLTTMIQSIQRNITGIWSADLASWRDCTDLVSCVNKYAAESINIACRWGYKDVESGDTLSDNYFNSRLPIVMKRIAQGGVRLAMILNRVLGDHTQENDSSVAPT
ncbi:UNVERIFIED_CONTAM: Endonuclease 4 [Sesamum indicum]